LCAAIASDFASLERIFTTAGRLSRHNSMSLKPQTLDKLVFLKMNSKALEAEPNKAFFV
jgi:hypothetical protein